MMVMTGVRQLITSTATAVPWVDLCGKAAPLLTMVMFAAPIPTLREIHTSQSVQQYPLLPYTSMVANTFLWSTYGILTSEPKIWSANALGLVLGAMYCGVYVVYHKDNTMKLLRHHASGVLGLIGVALFLAARHQTQTIGRLAVVLCIAMFGSPLATLAQVLRDRSATSIPLAFALVSGLNCVSWSVTGWWGMATGRDWNVVLPNVCGLSFAIAQLVLKVVFRSGGGKGSSAESIQVAL